jgi:predicted esterase
MAASLILRFPHHLSAAVLFRVMVPFRTDTLPDLRGVSIFLSAGQRDPIIPASNTREFAEMFETAGAEVSIHWHAGGHELGPDDVEAAKLWLTKEAEDG